MHHIVERPLCSKCSSIYHETFFREYQHGIRCLNCGHEKIVSVTVVSGAAPAPMYELKDRENTF